MSEPFFSLFAYTAQKLAEVVLRVPWPDVLATWDENPEASPWIGFRTLGAFKRAFPGATTAVSAGSLITKGRSRMAGHFLATGADVWVTCDDDVFAGEDVLHLLIDAARETHGIVSAPCVLRGSSGEVKLNLGVAPEAALERSRLVPLDRTGMGLVAMHRDAILAVSAEVPLATSGHHNPGDDAPFPALFLETLRYDADSPHGVGEWVGEDYAFSDRARASGVPIHALTSAAVCHAGVWGMLRPDLAVLIRGGEEGRFHPYENGASPV